MRIREYSKIDDKKVKNLINENLIETFGVGKSDGWEDFNFYKKSGRIFYVADEKGKIVGTAALVNKKSEGEIKRMYVKKDYYGKGLSKKLLDKIISFARDKEIKEIKLTTDRKRERAQSFYKKNGFRKTGERNNLIKFSISLK